MNIQKSRKYILIISAFIAVGLSGVLSKKALVAYYLSVKFAPIAGYEEYKVPDAPDYHDSSFWAALPETEDSADKLPLNTVLKENQESAEVDVFYVHPTTYANSDSWTADAKSKLEIYGVDPLYIQASVFNGSARVYAPRYRQATLYSFLDSSGSGKRAFDIAYKDIIRAFIHYLAYFNQGRPFIIAGHSQGSKMLIPVLRYLDRYPNKKFITAYVPGWQVSSKDFNRLKPCKGPREIGCFNVWNAKRWGAQLEEFIEPSRYIGSDCVNPISWEHNEKTVSNTRHKGAVSVKMDGIDRKYVTAKCHGEMLWVALPSNPDYESKRNPKNFHIVDYGLFYLDIRENIKLRIEAYNEQL